MPAPAWKCPAARCAWATRRRSAKGATVISTSTRNFPNRLGIDTRVYLSSAELASVAAMLGKIPTFAEYMEQLGGLKGKEADVYRYMNFDQIPEFVEIADSVNA